MPAYRKWRDAHVAGIGQPGQAHLGVASGYRTVDRRRSLGFAAYAAMTMLGRWARSSPPPPGAVGTIPLMPGGLLVVEAVLVPGLYPAACPCQSAISAMLITADQLAAHRRNRLGGALSCSAPSAPPIPTTIATQPIQTC